MWTLHSTTEWVKKGLKWISIFLLVALGIYLLYRGGLLVKEYFFPTPVEPPNVLYGKLPKMEFPKNVVSGDFTYDLQTITGFLPNFTDRGPVREFLFNTTSLLDVDRAREKVAKIGLTIKDPGTVEEKSITPIIYQWTQNVGTPQTVTLNTLNNTLSYVTPYLSNPELSNIPLILTPDQIINIGVDFFSRIGLFPTDIDPKLSHITFYRFSNGILTPVKKQEESQIARVDFVQKPLDSLPFSYTYPPKTNINVLVTSEEFQGRVVQASYFYQKSAEALATYPIKSSSVAYEELKDGKAYIASYTGTNQTIKIKDMILGYYLPSEDSKYLYPIFVFTGEDNFSAYLPAITAEWFE